MQQKSNIWSGKNFSPIIRWISDNVFNFYTLFILRTINWNLVNTWNGTFSDEWFDFCCIWIQNSLFTESWASNTFFIWQKPSPADANIS